MSLEKRPRLCPPPSPEWATCNSGRNRAGRRGRGEGKRWKRNGDGTPPLSPRSLVAFRRNDSGGQIKSLHGVKDPEGSLFKGETALLFNIDSDQSEAAITQPEDCHQAATEQEKRPLFLRNGSPLSFSSFFPPVQKTEETRTNGLEDAY